MCEMTLVEPTHTVYKRSFANIIVNRFRKFSLLVNQDTITLALLSLLSMSLLTRASMRWADEIRQWTHCTQIIVCNVPLNHAIKLQDTRCCQLRNLAASSFEFMLKWFTAGFYASRLSRVDVTTVELPPQWPCNLGFVIGSVLLQCLKVTDDRDMLNSSDGVASLLTYPMASGPLRW